MHYDGITSAIILYLRKNNKLAVRDKISDFFKNIISNNLEMIDSKIHL